MLTLPNLRQRIYAWFFPNAGLNAVQVRDVLLDVLDNIEARSGWQPVLALVPDGLRLVFQIIDYVGSAQNLNPKPPTGRYLGTTGAMINIADAMDVRGLPGVSPVLAIAPGLPNNGVPTSVLKVIGFQTSTGYIAQPDASPLYVSINGPYTSNIAYAADVRGSNGKDGATWRTSTGVPTASSHPQRADGVLDYCTDLLTGDVYRQLGSGNWGSIIGNMKGIQGIQGERGFRGWIQITLPVVDGNRIVRQVADYYGGEGTKPTDYIGQYLSTTGYTTNIAQAVDYRGPQGIQGNPGTLTASAFPEVNNNGGISDATYAVLQQGTTLQRIPLNALPIRMNSTVSLPSNVSTDLRGLLFGQYTDVFQGRLLETCEKWNAGTTAWDTQNATVTNSFQKLLAGRPFQAAQAYIFAGEKYRLTIQSDNSSDGVILAIFMGYFTGAVGFASSLKVTIETSTNNGTSYTTKLAETTIAFTNYYYFIPADIAASRVRITLEAVGTAGSNFALHGMGGFGGKSSNQGRYWGRFPIFWNWRQYVGIGSGMGNGPSDCAALEISATDAGLLLPRMTVAQRDAIASPLNGLIGYQSDNAAIWARISGAFQRLLSTGAGIATFIEGTLGVGVTPTYPVHVGASNPTNGILAEFMNTFNSTGRQGARIQIHQTGIAFWRFGMASESADLTFDGWTGTAFYTALTITNNAIYGYGSVGIGTSTPGEKFEVNGRIRGNCFVSNGPTPTITAGAGLGTGGTAAVPGTPTNMAGAIRLTTGSGGIVPNALLASLVLGGGSHPTPKAVSLQPVSAAAADLGGKIYVTSFRADGFDVRTSNITLPANTTYDFTYMVIY